MIERFRLSTLLHPWLVHEHAARYVFASTFVDSKIVVDAACGSGFGAVLFANSGARFVEAFDIDGSTIAEVKLKHNLSNLRFRVANCLELPVTSGFSDLYISLETIEHIENDSGYIREAVRVLKPGGMFICSTPNRTITNPCVTFIGKPRNPFHVREYSRQDFFNILSNEFLQVELFGMNPQSAYVVLVMKLCVKILPRFLAVRMPILFKIPKLFFDRAHDHTVEPALDNVEYEYLIAVCRKRIGTTL